MQYAISLVALAGALSVGGAAAQLPARADASEVLATVRIPHSVLANGKPLPAGTYELRLTNERPTPLVGQSSDAERWVEFVVSGTVVAREVAVVLCDSDLPPIGASSVPSPSGTRVEMLKGGEFVRVSVKKGGDAYLIYLPVVR